MTEKEKVDFKNQQPKQFQKPDSIDEDINNRGSNLSNSKNNKYSIKEVTQRPELLEQIVRHSKIMRLIHKKHISAD